MYRPANGADNILARYVISFTPAQRERLQNVLNTATDDIGVVLWKRVARNFIPHLDYYSEQAMATYPMERGGPMKAVLDKLCVLAIPTRLFGLFMRRINRGHLITFLGIDEGPMEIPNDRQNDPINDQNHTNDGHHSFLPELSSSDIERITNNFKNPIPNVLSRFEVFTGTYDAERVAVKRFLRRGQPNPIVEDEVVASFDANLYVLRKLFASPHKNIISAVAYCSTFPASIVFSYCEKLSLRQYIADSTASRSLKQISLIARGCCDGLTHFHSLGLFHGDIKPSNILLTADLVPKLSDFDQCPMREATDTEHITIAQGNRQEGAFSLEYLPPECRVLREDRVEATVERHYRPRDVYSLGVVLLELLSNGRTAGQRAYELADRLIERAMPATPIVGNTARFLLDKYALMLLHALQTECSNRCNTAQLANYLSDDVIEKYRPDLIGSLYYDRLKDERLIDERLTT